MPMLTRAAPASVGLTSRGRKPNVLVICGGRHGAPSARRRDAAVTCAGDRAATPAARGGGLGRAPPASLTDPTRRPAEIDRVTPLPARCRRWRRVSTGSRPPEHRPHPGPASAAGTRRPPTAGAYAGVQQPSSASSVPGAMKRNSPPTRAVEQAYNERGCTSRRQGLERGAGVRAGPQSYRAE